MAPLYGATRSVLKRNYALLAPDGFVAGNVPGWSAARCVVVVSPAIGAKFFQMLVTLGANGSGSGGEDGRERFVYVQSGTVDVRAGDRYAQLERAGFAYLPPDARFEIRANGGEAQLVVFEKRYAPLLGVDPPAPLFGSAAAVAGAPFLGDDAASLQVLLPDTPPFDMAVNIFTFQPGATLPFVETHIMEHGMLMVQGQGIYRLDADWHPVQQGDCVWMGPYCPQWFVATGKQPAGYIYYKDVNRDPMAE